MKSFRQFIIEEPTEDTLKDIRKRLQTGRLQRKYKAKTGKDLTPQDLERIADAE